MPSLDRHRPERMGRQVGDIADAMLDQWYEDGEEYDEWRDDVMKAEGIIGFVKPRKTAKGLTTYSFTLDDRDDERWFGTYTQEPPDVGVYVEFEYVTNGAGFNNVDNDTLKATENPDADVPAEVEGGAPAAKSGGASKAYSGAVKKDACIQWQAARNSAIAILGIAAAAGALDLGTGKKGSKLDALFVQVSRLTVDYFGHTQEVSETGEVPEDFRG